MDEIIEKVVAYITRRGSLLVFEHTQFPEAGVQVPAGTITPGEIPEKAILRECSEETGLTDFMEPVFLDIQEFTTMHRGTPERIRRHFFHVICNQDTPERWTHMEMDPSEGPPGPIEFEFYWVKMPADVPELSGDLGIYLQRLPQYDDS
jgi:8-oxo-dGTP pyrophosphatase MutT (NUDIX family)